MSKIADVTQSFRKYLDTQKDYFDYLRKRPRFFLSTHYVDKRLAVVKTSVEEAKKEEGGGGLRRRRDPEKVKQPVKQPVKQREGAEQVKEPVSTPVKAPPIIKSPVLNLPAEKPARTPSPGPGPAEAPTPPGPGPGPAEAPPPPGPGVPRKFPPLVAPPPVKKEEKKEKEVEVDQPDRSTPAYYGPIISEGIAKALEENKSQSIEMPDGGRVFIDRKGRVKSVKTGPMVREGEKESQFWLNLFTISNAPAILFPTKAVPGKVLGTGPSLTPATGTTGGPGGLSNLIQAVNNIVKFTRTAVPFSYGGIASGPTFSLAGERTTELALPQGKINEFINALYREAGSISVGIAESVARQVGADSATMSVVSKLKSIFGAAKGFEVGGINIPGQIPVIDTADPEVEQRGVKNMFQRAISFGKNIAKSVVPIAVAAAGGVLSAGAAQAHHEEPLSAAPVMVPEYDPTMQGAQITPKGSTDTDNISGYPITSRYGPRWGRLHGGIDVGVPTGTAIGLNVPGEIVFAGTAGGYGYVIDAWVPSLGAQFRLAHLSRFFKKSGTFTAGEALGETGGAKGHPGAGSSTGPHLHYEIDTTKGGSGYGGARDPELLSKLSKHIMMGSMSQGTGEEETEGEGGQEFTYNSKEKTSELDIVRQQTTKTLERSRVNSIVEIPISGPTSYTPQLTTVMREKSPKRPYIISPFSKGVDQ